MKKIFKTLFSMEVMTVLLVFMALACAVATFIENDFGPLGSKSFVYGQTWFEIIMLLLTIGVIFNIIWFKMYKLKKFFIFMIHISLVFIFIGAALTRYLGYEAIMTIPEGAMENKVYSSDEYIQIKIDDETYDKKVLMTPLWQSNFDYDTTIDNKPLEIKFNRFVQNAVEKIVPATNGKPLMNILVSEFSGTKSFDLKDNSHVDSKLISFSLNKKIDTKKPTVNFEIINNDFYISSNLKLTQHTQDMTQKRDIKANTKIKLDIGSIFQIGQTHFRIPQAQIKGNVAIVSDFTNEIPKEMQLNAVILDVTYNNNTIEVPLYGRGGSNKGISRNLIIANKNINFQWGTKEFTLPFSILLNDFKLDRYPGSMSPSSYSSDVKIYDKQAGDSFEYKIYMNNVLDYKGYRFFQSSYKMDESATILSVNKDPGKIPTYIGYALLFTGLLLSLFISNSRFKKLSTKKYTVENIKHTYSIKKAAITLILGLLFVVTPQDSFSQNLDESQKIILNIDKNHSDQLGSLIIQDYQGRIKPLNSLAIEIMNKITRKNELYGLDANQFFISMILYPETWKKLAIFKVKNPKTKELLDLKPQSKYFKFNDIYTKSGEYKLQNVLEIANNKKASLRNKFDKEIIKIDERLNIAYALYVGDFLRAFPLKGDKNNKWLNITEATSYDSTESKLINNIIKKYYFSLIHGTTTNNWDKANNVLEEIKDFQMIYASRLIPSDLKIQAELFFNKFNIFERLTPFYLILGFVLLTLVFINIFNPKIKITKVTKITLYFLIVAFILHTIGLALRWYISGHAPWSNGYESMIYIAWAIALSGIFFSKHSHLALATTSILSGITLFVAHLSWMEPQITTLAPVLKSYWLTIHVSVITASYGFLALSALLGFISLCLFIFANPKKENDRFFRILVSIKESNRINEMSILLGLVLLVIGNFLGGIWANESWGRYWGWDPKETWTLISIIIYAIILHLKYIKDAFNDYTLSVLSVISYFSIIMTYFGVNYFLSGKHSYAAGDPIQIPTFVYVSIIIIFAVITMSFKNRKVL